MEGQRNREVERWRDREIERWRDGQKGKEERRRREHQERAEGYRQVSEDEELAHMQHMHRCGLSSDGVTITVKEMWAIWVIGVVCDL